MIEKRKGMNWFIGFNICSKSKFLSCYCFIIGFVMFSLFKVHRIIKTQVCLYIYIFVPKILCRFLWNSIIAGSIYIKSTIIGWISYYSILARYESSDYSQRIGGTWQILLNSYFKCFFSMYLFNEVEGKIIWFLCRMCKWLVLQTADF